LKSITQQTSHRDDNRTAAGACNAPHWSVSYYKQVAQLSLLTRCITANGKILKQSLDHNH